MNEFMNFNKMLTPTIIKIIFLAGCGLSVLLGIGLMIAGIADDYGGGFMVFTGLVVMVVGPFFTRIHCELLIVLFKMHENLHIISKNYENSNTRNIM